MGVVAMKTLKGAKHRGLENYAEHSDSYAQAALKWVASNKDVSCAVISMFEMQHVEEYLYASGKQLTDRDLAILGEYVRQIAGKYCSPHCGACHDSCPEGLPIADILRHRMYFEDYGAEKVAMEQYAKLVRDSRSRIDEPTTTGQPVLHSGTRGLPPSLPKRSARVTEWLKLPRALLTTSDLPPRPMALPRT